MTQSDLVVVTSTAVEDSVPDVQAARRIGAQLMTRAELLAELFNAAPQSIAIGGTSGKTTTTGMIGWILHQAGRDPTIMNGGVMKNFVGPETQFASALVGNSDVFVSEVDESDGSIANYTPRIAVLNNVSLDHKSLDELRILFADFVTKAATAVLNLDNEETAAIAAKSSAEKVISYSLANRSARLFGTKLVAKSDAISFEVTDQRMGATVPVQLRVPGSHNVANALAALGAALAVNVALKDAAAALQDFIGIRRRLEIVGSATGITVIDDFAHNPDKIAATLATLHTFSGRLLIMFQPHGFGPLRKMKDAFIECFARDLGEDDVLLMPDPVYFGGTVDRSVTSSDIVLNVRDRGGSAFCFVDRDGCRKKLMELARPGDRIVVMGARDDSLSQFAAELLAELENRSLGHR